MNELDKEIKAFVKKMKGKTRMPQKDIKIMFDLHNKKFKDKETQTTCHLCVVRVFAKLKKV